MTQKVMFSATLLKVERVPGKAPKAAFDIHGFDGAIGVELASQLMTFGKDVVVTVEEAQMSMLDEEDDDAGVSDDQTSIPLVLVDNDLVDTTTGEAVSLEPKKRTKSTPEPVPFEPTPAEVAEETEAAEEDAIAGGFSIGLEPAKPVVRDEVVVPSDPKRVWPSQADVWLGKVRGGEISTQTVDGARFTLYSKDGLLMLEVADSDPNEAIKDAKTIFGLAGVEYSARDENGTYIFTQFKEEAE